MSFDTSLEKKILYLLDDLELLVIGIETPPHKRTKVLKSAFFNIYSLLEHSPVAGSPLLDWLLANKSLLLASSFIFSAHRSRADAFILFLLDSIRQSLSLLDFYKKLCDADLQHQDELVETLKQILVSLKQDKSQQKEFSTFISFLREDGSDMAPSISNMLINDDIAAFRLTSVKNDVGNVDQCVELKIEVDSFCSLEWIQQRYPLLGWSKVLDSHSAETFIYKDIIDSIELYEDSGAAVSSVSGGFCDYLTQKIEAYRLRYAFKMDDLIKSGSNIFFKQKLANVFFPTCIKKEVEFFLEDKLAYADGNQLISYFRFNGESYLSVLSYLFESDTETCSLTSGKLDTSKMVSLPLDASHFDLNNFFLLEYDSLYLDVLIITLKEKRYLVPKYQILGFTHCQSDIVADQSGASYYDLDGLDILVFQHIDWSISPKKSVFKTKSSEDKKIVFIEQAGLIFGLLCDFVSESTTARKLSSKNTMLPTLAAFWSTREGEVLGEFTPLQIPVFSKVEALSEVASNEGKSCQIAFLGRYDRTLIAVERNLDCSIENITVDKVFELNKQNDNQLSYFTLFKGVIYPIKNLTSDFDSKKLQRGSLVYFHEADKNFAIYFSSISFDIESVMINGSKVLLWNSLTAFKSIRYDDQEINVIVKSR
ncbi:hypothetical protein [Marinomonas algicola]|uniref:hypothetical protein n=1 Tax=Marinomonas algicola TaxID=2773454 RepID=UPI00174DD11A|nr:hypothetical protein [Marinomonas algicola]